MKLVSYDPNEVKNISTFFNEYLSTFKDEKYVMFIFNDILDKVKDKSILCGAYESLLRRLDLPYAFFPYYIHFNKVFPDSIAKPSPRMSIKLKDDFLFDVVGSPAYGMLVVDVEKLQSINFSFNEEYRISFYIQDLINACHKNNLYFSSMYFIDVHNSYELFDSEFKEGHGYDAKEFMEEKSRFFGQNQIAEEKINDYLMTLKNTYGTATPEPAPTQEAPQNAEVNIDNGEQK